MIETLPIMGFGWALIFAMMTAFWFIQRSTGNAAIVDVGWPSGIVVMVWLYMATLEGVDLRMQMVAGLVTFWGLRLTGYVLMTRIIGEHEEDGRYTTLREHWGDKAQRNLFFFFQAQGLLCVIFSIPFIIVMRNPAEMLTPIEWSGLQIGAIAVIGEALADYQLYKFKLKSDNKGKVCNVGLWRYSRHPNYFFEWLYWWSFVIMALQAPYGWVTLIGPVLMHYFLFRVTGIPYAEQQALKSRGDAYREYQRTTSKFFPWFPNKDAA